MEKFLWKEFLVVFVTNAVVIFYVNKMMYNELNSLTCAILSVVASVFCYALLRKYIKKER